MEEKIIKLAKFACELETDINNTENKIEELNNYMENNNNELKSIYEEIKNDNLYSELLIKRISLELCFLDFISNGITENERDFFNKTQKEYIETINKVEC